MQDSKTTEAQEAAETIIQRSGFPMGRDSLKSMLALAYAQGARVASQEAAEAVRETVKSA